MGPELHCSRFQVHLVLCICPYFSAINCSNVWSTLGGESLKILNDIAQASYLTATYCVRL